MSHALITQFEQLQNSARELRQKLQDSAVKIRDFDSWPDATLPELVQSYQLSERAYRENLSDELNRAELIGPDRSTPLSLAELKLLTQTLASVCEAREWLTEARQRVEQAPCAASEKGDTLAELRRLEARLIGVRLPLTDELVDLATLQHAIVQQVEEVCARPAPPAPQPAPVPAVKAPLTSQSVTALPAISVPGSEAERPVRTAEDAADDDARDSVFGDESVGLAGDEDHPQISGLLPGLKPDQLPDRSTAAPAAAVDTSAASSSVDPPSAGAQTVAEDADSIFDDFEVNVGEKQILTATELNQRYDQLQQELLQPREVPAEVAETRPHVEVMPQDSVFDELEGASVDRAPNPTTGMIHGHLPGQLEQTLSRVFDEQTRQASETPVLQSPSSAASADRDSQRPTARPLSDDSAAAAPLLPRASSPALPLSSAMSAAVSSAVALHSPVAGQEDSTAALSQLPLADYSGIMEYAGRADQAQNRFDRVSYLSRLIWELISQGEYSWAYQVSNCLFCNVDKDLKVPAPPPWLLELLLLGDQVRLSSGRVARQFQATMATHKKAALQIAENPDSAEAYLLRAALMRGAITTASVAAADILRTFVIQPDQTQLYNYCSRIASFCTRSSGLKLDPYFYRPGAASIESESKRIRSQVAAWKTAVFEKWIAYRLNTPLFARAHWCVQPSAAVASPTLQQGWRVRQIVQSHISRLIQPILENRLEHNSVMESELRRLSQSVLSDGQNTRVIISNDEVVSLPGRSFYNHVQQALDYGSQWLVLATAYPGIESVLVPQEVNELRDEIDRRQGSVFRELLAAQKTHASHAHRAAMTACRRNMDRIHQLFHPSEEARLGEQDPNCLMNADLLKIPGISLDDDWSCHVNPATLEHQILVQLSQGPVDWEEAFAHQLDAGAYRSARSILRLEFWSDGQREELRGRLEQRRRDNADSLKVLSERVRQQVQESRQFDIISPREAEQYLEQIAAIEKRMPGEYRLDRLRQDLLQMRQTLDGRRGLELKKMKERMTRLHDFDSRREGGTSADRRTVPSPPTRPEEPSRPEASTDRAASAAEDKPEENDDWALDV